MRSNNENITNKHLEEQALVKARLAAICGIGSLTMAVMGTEQVVSGNTELPVALPFAGAVFYGVYAVKKAREYQQVRRCQFYEQSEHSSE